MGFFKKIREIRKKNDDRKKRINDLMNKQPKKNELEHELESIPKPEKKSKPQSNKENAKESIRELDPNEVKKRKDRIEKTRDNMSSYFESKIPTLEEILHSEGNPYIIFGISNKTTCQEIKAQYKELSIKYNAARGITNKTKEEIEKVTKAQMMVNHAHEELKKDHNCG